MTSTRDRLLDATEAVTTKLGTSSLTLELVASTASVSKGGLLYHFPSKTALIQGMLDRRVAVCWERFNAHEPTYSDLSNPTLRTMLALVRSLRSDEWDLHAALALGLSENPDLLAPMRQLFEIIWARIETECDNRNAAYAIWSALEGQTMFRLLSIEPIPFEQLGGMFQYLEQLVDALPAKGNRI